LNNHPDHFEITLRDVNCYQWQELMDWIDDNYVECHRIEDNQWAVTGSIDAMLMKLRWGWSDNNLFKPEWV
jgi:hypothetical protein